MRGWRPRRPANRLKRRLFGRVPETSAPEWHWLRLVPAAACLFLVLTSLNFRPSDPWPGRELALASVAPTNPAGFLTPYASGTVSQNRMDAITFEWTNRGHLPSSIGFAPNTNLSR